MSPWVWRLLNPALVLITFWLCVELASSGSCRLALTLLLRLPTDSFGTIRVRNTSSQEQPSEIVVIVVTITASMTQIQLVDVATILIMAAIADLLCGVCLRIPISSIQKLCKLHEK